jgi:hypothetical protein
VNVNHIAASQILPQPTVGPRTFQHCYAASFELCVKLFRVNIAGARKGDDSHGASFRILE